MTTKTEGDIIMFLNRYQTNLLRAIAIFCVLLGHGFRKFSEKDFLLFEWGGAIGVAIFLVISGYGLTESYKEKGIDRRFFQKRIRTVMIPYWIMMIFQTLLDHFVFNRNISNKEWIISFIGYNNYSKHACIDSTMWYITFILLWYLLFFLVFSLKIINDHVKVLLMSGIAIICFVNKLYLTSDWYINYFSFIIGICASLYGDKISHIILIKKILFSVSLVVMLVSSAGYFRGIIHTKELWIIYGSSGALFLILLVELYIKIPNSEIVTTIGKASFWIYLIENCFCGEGKGFSILNIEGSNIDIIIFIVMSIEAGILLYKIYDGMNHILAARFMKNKEVGQLNDNK